MGRFSRSRTCTSATAPSRSVSGIDFDVEEGKTTVLLGLNGAGKTTTVTTIAGLLNRGAARSPLPASASRAGTARTSSSAASCSCPKAGGCSLAHVAQNLRLGSWTSGRRKAELRAAEERVYEYFPVSPSGATSWPARCRAGEQQMLAIGRALMSLPRLMLIDEASLGLSPRLAKTCSRSSTESTTTASP